MRQYCELREISMMNITLMAAELPSSYWFSLYGKEGRKEIFYLTTHSTHFIYGHMAKDQSVSEGGNPLPPHELLIPISSTGSFICTIPRPLLHQSWITGWNRSVWDWYVSVKEGRKEIFYLKTHSAHFIYGYMASDIWQMTTQIAREETRCRQTGYCFRLTAKVVLF